MNIITFPVFGPQLTKPQRGELHDILTRKAKAACRKAGISFWTGDNIKFDGGAYAEFWFRTGQASTEEEGNGYLAEFTGILQFSIYPTGPDNSFQMEGAAEKIAEKFSDREWIADEAVIATHQMAWKRLPATDTRRAVVIVDGSFTYSVWLAESGKPTLN